MNLLKPIIRSLIATCMALTLPLLGHAGSTGESDSVILPTLTVMAEPELRAVIEVVPYQEDAAQQQALQMRLMEIERDIQAYSVDADFVANIDVMRAPAPPDLDSLPVIFQEYVLAVAQGLLSSDPRNGLYVVLQPFGINRDATTVQIAREQFNSYRNQLNLSLPSPSR